MELGIDSSPVLSNKGVEKFENYYKSSRNNKRFSLTERAPISNDWDSVIQNQVHDAKIKKMKEETQKKSMQARYHADLDLIRSMRDEQKQVEDNEKTEERLNIDQTFFKMNSEQAVLNTEEHKFK